MSLIFTGGPDPQYQRVLDTQGNIPSKRPTSHHSLPSPSPSHSTPEERDELLSSGPRELRRKSHSAPASPVSEVVSGRCPLQGRSQKRKRSVTDRDSCDYSRKRWASGAKLTTPVVDPLDETEGAKAAPTTQDDPIGHWAETQEWPNNFASMSQDRSDSSRKRPPSSSYSQNVKAGDAPKAHSAAHERKLAEHGLYMDELRGRSSVQDKSKELCRDLLKGTHPDPTYTMFPLSEFLSVWQRVQDRNESRVFRDLTPLLVPSPELLYINGHQELEHVVEDINGDWTKCTTLGGPQPKPDFAVGISPLAFDEEELAKLKNHTAFERTTTVADNLYFPFLMCEAKSGDGAISKADRQNMHSCSIAVNALIQLYRSWGEHKAAELSGQILVFSVSHDNVLVKLYGHFAVVDGEKTSFYRHPVASFVLNFEENQGRKRTHDFVREIYKTFYPAHLQRIRDALAAMDDPRDVSAASTVSMGDESVAEPDPSAQSSQEATSSFKVPGIPASKKQKNELALLRAQLTEQQRQNSEQLTEQQRQSKEQMALLERQLEQQRKDAEQQRKEMKEREGVLSTELEEQRKEQKELMKMLQQQGDQITKQNEHISRLLQNK